MSSEEEPPVRVRSREGVEVTCSRKAARRAGTLSNWMDDTAGEQAFRGDVPVVDLRMILGLCEDDDSSQLASHSVEELIAVMVGANCLDAPGAFSAAARELNTRFLAGKSVEELRTNLGAENDLSEAEQAAALAEPAVTPPPPWQAEHLTVKGQPRLQRGVSLLAPDQVLWEALQEADSTTLCRLKAVSVAWRARARRELWRRLYDRLGWRELWGPLCELCHRDVDGQPKPTRDHVADITDLDVMCLQDAGRLWGVVVAGRQQLLPKLARLHGYGFVVDVQAVREAEGEAERFGEGGGFGEAPLGGAALRRCIEGEGEPPPELLLAAVACAASGKVRNVPVQQLREDAAIGFSSSRHTTAAIGSLDFGFSHIGVIGAGLLGLMLPAATSVRSLRCVDGAIRRACLHASSPLRPTLTLARSLHGNRLCGLDNCFGTYTTKGITELCEGLRGSAITSLECAAAP